MNKLRESEFPSLSHISCTTRRDFDSVTCSVPNVWSLDLVGVVTGRLSSSAEALSMNKISAPDSRRTGLDLNLFVFGYKMVTSPVGIDVVPGC